VTTVSAVLDPASAKRGVAGTRHHSANTGPSRNDPICLEWGCD
jgi:hypothetical protein